MILALPAANHQKRSALTGKPWRRYLPVCGGAK
jgi:hypothetical protein